MLILLLDIRIFATWSLCVNGGSYWRDWWFLWTPKTVVSLDLKVDLCARLLSLSPCKQMLGFSLFEDFFLYWSLIASVDGWLGGGSSCCSRLGLIRHYITYFTLLVYHLHNWADLFAGLDLLLVNRHTASRRSVGPGSAFLLLLWLALLSLHLFQRRLCLSLVDIVLCLLLLQSYLTQDALSVLRYTLLLLLLEVVYGNVALNLALLLEQFEIVLIVSVWT